MMNLEASTRRSTITVRSNQQKNEDYRLDIFGRHIPRILMKQLIAKLTDQFMNQTSDNDADQVGAFSCTPSLGRFDAALLFVDISGFTVLSQRLPVDELRLCINNYFKIILDTIIASDGDVVKFAGDALFVIWQIEEENTENESLNSQMKMKNAVAKAVQCGLQINRLCSNYRVDFKKKLNTTDESITDLVMQQNQLPLPADITPRGEIEEDHTFLNVHSGCSCGTFAGIDVGAMDRWEYLMIGDPLQDVADAESAAEKGELVLSKDAHDILCQTRCNSEGENNAVAETKSEHSLNDDPILPCGCTRTANGCYRLSPDFSANAVFFSQMSQDEGDDDIDYEQIYYRHVVDSAFHAFEVSKEFIMQRFHSYLHSSQTSDRNETESDQKKSMLTSASAPVFSKTNLHMEHFVYEFYLKWLMTCLTSDFARHVHEADRIDFEMSKVNRLNCLQTCAEQYKLTSCDGLNDSSAGAGRHSSESFVRRIRSIGASNDRSSSFSENSNYLREKNQKKHEKLLRKDRELTGELRNVIVMFIAIKSTSKPKSITFDSSVDEEDADDCAFSAFKFLKRSRSEKDADVKLKKHYQTCMSLIVSSLKEKGGQLRQFIVDDKGTVAIGSFGLRGSTTYDNAASAVEAALNIILHLQNVGLNAAIGITSGKAYCGVVGSTKRHEYAVMGPSVNLSARLMGQAKPGEIICDVSTRSVDRIHSYRAVGEVKAKGYADLVSIFKPVFNRGSVGLPTGIRTSFFQQVDEGGSRKIKEAKKSNFKELVGRDTEEFEVLSIILTDVADNKSINFLQTVQEILAGSEERRVISESNLNTSCSARILVVNGTSGIGKSALIDSICDKLSRFTKKTSWNLQIFHGKSSSLTISDPFKPWHNIIRSILSQLARYTHIIRERREGEVEVTDRTVIVRKWLKGLDYLSSYLTEEERNWFPLLTTANIVPGIEENDITKKLSGQQKLEVITKLLKSIVNQYPILTNKVLMVVLDDSHFMDPHSWKLTHEILQSNKGIIFLASYYDANEENVNIASIGSGEEPKDALITAATSPRTTGRTQLQELIFELASCRKIKLNGLDAKAIRHMASHIFEGIDLTNVDNSIFSTFEETSGGNPLYIYEIALACLEKMKRYIGETGCEMIDLFTTKDGSKSVFTSLMGEFRTNRIDEVIYYRFDRLDAQSQLLLKMGAIITISNSQRGFNLEMLLHMLNHDSLEPEETTYGKDSMALSPDGDSSKSLRGLFSCFDIKNDNKKNYLLAAQELSAKLQEMTNSSSFIKIVQTRRRSSFNSEKEEMIRAISLTSFRADGENNQKDESDEDHEEKLLQELSEVYYDFNIALERKTIYDLMLDDQKESLHDRIASHLEKENEHAQKSNYLTFSDLNEEAFHWEKATVWGNAMSCYYRAGMILDSLGAFKESYEYLGKAYRMLVLLRKDANVNENVYHKVKFDTLLQEFISLNQSNEQSSLQQSESSFAVTRIDVYNTFGGDANLLEVAINLLLRFGQASFSLGENASFTSRIYEDALRLMILTWPSTSSKAESPTHKKRLRKQATRSRLKEVQAQMDSFKLKDPSICFPLIAGMAALYRNRRLADDEEHSNEKCLYAIMLNFAKSAPNDYQIHYLQAVCLMNSLHNELGHYDEANQLLPEILSLYNAEQHSAALVKTYGNDRIPYTIAMITQTFLLLGYLPQAMTLLQQLSDDWLPGISHLHSMGSLSLALTPIRLFIRQAPKAEEVFMIYRNTELAREGAYSFFRDMNDILQDYFQVKQIFLQGDYVKVFELFGYCEKNGYCVRKPSHEQKTTEGSSSSSSPSVPFRLVSFVEKIMNKFYYKKDNRPLLYDVIFSFGIPIEAICADILLMIEESFLHLKVEDDTPMNLLSLALEYCEVAIEQTKIGFRLMFSYMMLLFTKLRILLRVVICSNQIPTKYDENKLTLMNHIALMVQITGTTDFTFIQLQMIKLLQWKQYTSIFTVQEYQQLFPSFTSDASSSSSTSSSSSSYPSQIEQFIIQKLEKKNQDYYIQTSNANFQIVFNKYFSSVENVMEVLTQNINEIFPLAAPIHSQHHQQQQQPQH